MDRIELFELADRIVDCYGDIVTGFGYGPQSGRYSLLVRMPNGEVSEVQRHDDWDGLEPAVSAWYEWTARREASVDDTRGACSEKSIP